MKIEVPAIHGTEVESAGVVVKINMEAVLAETVGIEPTEHEIIETARRLGEDEELRKDLAAYITAWQVVNFLEPEKVAGTKIDLVHETAWLGAEHYISLTKIGESLEDWQGQETAPAFFTAMLIKMESEEASDV